MDNLTPARLGLRIWDDCRVTLKSHQISSRSRASEIGPNPKSPRMVPEIIGIPTSVVFRNADIQTMTQKPPEKKNLETSIDKTPFCSKATEKLSICGPEIHVQSSIIKAWTPQCPSLCSLMPRIVPGSPNMAKWTHKACQLTIGGTKKNNICVQNTKNQSS